MALFTWSFIPDLLIAWRPRAVFQKVTKEAVEPLEASATEAALSHSYCMQWLT